MMRGDDPRLAAPGFTRLLTFKAKKIKPWPISIEMTLHDETIVNLFKIVHHFGKKGKKIVE